MRPGPPHPRQVAAALRPPLEGGAPASPVARLSLAGNGLMAEGARAVAATLADGTKLRELSLQANHIGDKGAAHLAAALRKNATLHSLNLVRGGTPLGRVAALHETIR